MSRGDPAIAAATRALLASWRLRAWAAIAALVGVQCARMPLFDTLGFEQALAATVLASLAGLDLGAALARRAAAAPAAPLDRAVRPWRLVVAVCARAAAVAVAVAAIPGAIAAVRGAWHPVCDWRFGVVANLGLPLATAALAGAVGACVGLAAPRPWPSTLGWIAVWLALLVDGVHRELANPPVFSYSPLVGYFPGNLYDEDVTLGMPLLWARLEQLLVVGALVALIATFVDAPSLRVRARARRPGGVRWPEALVALALAAGAVAMRCDAGDLGYAVDAGDLDAALDGVRRTPHFVIHYARRPDIEARMDLIAADHEFRYAQVVRQLGAEADGPIDSYYFADPDQKARWMGARGVEMAKPWRREIYLHDLPFPHESLRHEIAHVVAGRFGDPWFGVSARRVAGLPILANPGLIEGIAVAADWPTSSTTLTPHEAVKVMVASGLEPSLSDVMSLSFLAVSPARSYQVGGSFVRYLLDRFGTRPVQALYGSGGDFEGTLGVSAAQLERDWRAMIAAVPVAPEIVEASVERFRRGSVFAVPCPHAIAAREAQAGERFATGDRAGAVAIMRDVCADDPDEPGHQLALAAMLDDDDGSAGERGEAVAIWRRIADDRERTASVRASALLKLALHAGRAGDWGAARAAIDRGAALPASDDAHRQFEGLAAVLAHRGPAAPALVGHFFGGGDARAWAVLATELEPTSGLAWYLRGLRELDRDDQAAAAAALEKALDLGLPGPRFVSNAARRLAVAAWRAGDRAAVARAADVMAGSRVEVERLAADDWRQRLAFAATGALPPAPAPR